MLCLRGVSCCDINAVLCYILGIHVACARAAHRCVFTNSTAFQRPTELYDVLKATILARNQKLSLTMSHMESREFLQRHFEASATRCTQPILLILDEVDHLFDHDPSSQVTRDLYRWAASPALVLITMANSLRLPARASAALHANGIALPEVIAFKPYTVEQLRSIIASRMDISLLDSRALELCLKKVQATTGDARRALDLVHHALQAAVEAIQSQEDGGAEFCVPLVTMKQIQAAIKLIPNARASLETIHNLPQQVQVLLCILSVSAQGQSTWDVPLKRVKDAYALLVRKRMVGGDVATMSSVWEGLMGQLQESGFAITVAETSPPDRRKSSHSPSQLVHLTMQPDQLLVKLCEQANLKSVIGELRSSKRRC